MKYAVLFFLLLVAGPAVGQETTTEPVLDPAWVEKQIKDALQAAPAVVTHDARIFAWTEEGKRVLVREGSGPYTCVASGSYSLRLGQPPLPHPDPLCADQNAWAFFEAIWAEDDPLNPDNPLPSAPGLVWMLGGMNISGGQVRYGEADEGRLRVGAANADTVVTMTPHVMIWPLPIDPQIAELPETYHVSDPPHQWIMAAGTPVAHMHVHFSEATASALRKIPPPNEDAMLLTDSAWAQGDFQSGHFETSDGAELHYLEGGSGPLVVFVPGWTMPAWIWQAQLEHFAASNRVVALDPRGHGASERATYGYDAERMSRDICELLEHLQDAPAVIVGWSIAGQYVLLCAEEVGPDVVEAVVVVDWDLRVEADEAWAAGRIASLQEDRSAFTRGFVEAIHVDPRAQYVDRLTEAALSVPTNAAAMSIANFHFFGPHDMGPILDGLDRPVLLIFSSLDWAVEAAEEARDSWPAVRVEVIDGTSHALFVDRPDQFNRVLEAFLSSLRQ